MRVGRDGGWELGERASQGSKSAASRRSANRVNDMALRKREVFIHDHPVRRRV